MKYLCIVPLLLLFACVPTQRVQEVPTTVGYYNYGKNMQQVMEKRKAECDKNEECKEPEALTEQDVLALITAVKNQLQVDGMTVIGIEADKTRVWFEKPVE